MTLFAADAPSISPELRAADDAFQNLVDKVLALRLEDDLTTVAELLILPAGSPGTAPETTARPERELRRALLAECQRGDPRLLASDGVEVDLWLPTPRLNEILRSVAAAELPKVDKAKVVLHSTAGPTITAAGRYMPDGRPRDERPGWRQCDVDQIVQTATAVRLDVRRRLLDRIAAMRVPGADRLRLAMVRYPSLNEAITKHVRDVPLGEPTFEPTGVCRLALSISRGDLRGLVQAAVAECTNLPSDLAQAATPAGDDVITIEGFAVPPPCTVPISGGRPVTEPGRPDWADRVLSVQATGVPPDGVQEPQARRAMALKAARLEAARRLWLDIENLPLRSGTVGEYLAGHAQMDETAAAIDKLIVPMSEPIFDGEGRAAVTLGVRLDPLWRIIRDLR